MITAAIIFTLVNVALTAMNVTNNRVTRGRLKLMLPLLEKSMSDLKKVLEDYGQDNIEHQEDKPSTPVS